MPVITVRAAAVLFAGLVVLAACRPFGDRPSGDRTRTEGPVSPEVLVLPGADADRGRTAIGDHGCGACHVIPGIRNARGRVGPPLTGLRERGVIAGRLSNSGENLARWIRDPQTVSPGNAMPDLGLSEQEARDIAAYLLERR